jgi:hypothetical protein
LIKLKFGRRVGEAGITNQSAATGDWPKSLRKGETRVRFLSEISDWNEYWEHFDDTVKFFPCTGDKSTCPGCTSPVERTAKASKRYLAPVLDPKTGKVWGLKMGIDLANRMSLRSDRNNGTVVNRDYTLIRTGDGLDTEYDVEQEEIVAINLDVYRESIDMDELLMTQFLAAWPDAPEMNGNRPSAPPVKATAKAAPRAPRQRKPEPEDEPTESQKITENLRAKAKAKAEAELASDEPPFEQKAGDETDASSDEQTVEITEEDLRKMPRQDLIKLARQADISITLTMSREEIVNLFLDQFAV